MNPAEDYILSREEPFRSILLHLHAVIETVIIDVDMKCKWGKPYLKSIIQEDFYQEFNINHPYKKVELDSY